MGLIGLLAFAHIGVYIFLGWEGRGNPWIRNQAMTVATFTLAWGIKASLVDLSILPAVAIAAGAYGIYILWTINPAIK